MSQRKLNTKKALLAAMRAMPVTQQTVDAFERRVDKREEEFAATARRQRIGADFLNRRYTI